MENCFEYPEAVEYSLLKKVRIPIILNLMKIENKDIILDVGSGAGYFTKILSRNSKSVISLDISFINAKNAKQSMNLQNVYFVVGDATRLPIKKNVIDKILATEIIEHIEKDTEFIKESERTLKTMGSIIITTPCTNPTLSLDWLRKIFGVNYNKDFGHVRGGYTRKELETLLSKGKFNIISISYFSQFFTEIGKIIIYIGQAVQSNSKNWTSGKSQNKIISTKKFRFYKLIFPILYQFSKIDILISSFKGHHIVLKAYKIERE